jgi:Holliday junction resolvase RusA-like endonuclease
MSGVNKIIRITIKIEPTPKGRARTTWQAGHIWTFTPQRTNDYENELKLKLKRHQDECFAPGIPVKLTCTFFRTKSKYLPQRETMPYRKSDLDNYLKALLDCLNGILVADDAAITTIHARKRWTDKEYGYINIRLEEDTC